MTRDEIAADRERLLREVADAFVALRNAPEWVIYEAAEHRLIEHRVLYGDGDLTREPTGLLDFGDPGAFES